MDENQPSSPPEPALPLPPGPPAPLMVFEPADAAPPSRRGRGLLYGVVATFAVLAIALAAVVALRGDSDGEAEAAFSLAAAAQQTVDANTMEFDMTMSLGPMGEVTLTAGVDNDAKLMEMSMAIESFAGGSPDSGTMRMIIDVGNATMYMDGSGLGMTADTEWVSMDLAAIAEQSGMSIEQFQDQFAADPADVARLFTEAGDVVDLGEEIIDGTPVRHFRVTVNLADALAANPQLEQQLGQLDELGGELPTDIDYDVWVTEDNQLRRMTFELEMLGEQLVVEIDVTSVGEPLDISIPPPDEVTEMDGLFGS